ncbi:MOSC domain-containing protein [Microvirga sp. P5_D2]
MTKTNPPPIVLSVHANGRHAFSKVPKDVIRLIENWGVEGDVHAGSTDRHRFHMRRFGQIPNLRQVHLIQSETLEHVGTKGHIVRPGDLGENISTKGVDLLALPTGTRLRLGPEAVIELTGLRNPCVQIEKFQPGLVQHLVERQPAGLVRKAGVMSIVLKGGEVKPGDTIIIEKPPLPHIPLIYVKPTAGRVKADDKI